MQTLSRIQLVGNIVSFLVLIIGFLIMYRETGEVISSVAAAVLAAVMVWGTFIIMKWLAQVFLK